MFDFITYGPAKLQLFFLVLVRASGLFFAAPILGHRSIAAQMKVGLMILFAIVVVPVLHHATMPPVSSLVELAAMVLGELMVGILIGFFFALLFKGAEMAGAITGFQIGLIIAQAFDPNAGGQVPIIGRLWLLLASLIFMAINGHHLVIHAFNDSYHVIPPGQVLINGGTPELMMKYTAYTFVMAVKIAAPVLVTLVLADVALGTVAKMMPTMNIFIVGFPLKVGLGLLVVAMSLPVFSYVLEKSTSYLNRAMGELLASMGRV